MPWKETKPSRGWVKHFNTKKERYTHYTLYLYYHQSQLVYTKEYSLFFACTFLNNIRRKYIGLCHGCTLPSITACPIKKRLFLKLNPKNPNINRIRIKDKKPKWPNIISADKWTLGSEIKHVIGDLTNNVLWDDASIYCTQ